MTALQVLEEVIDRSGAAARIEILLPIGARPRQLLVRTLLLGMLLVLADHRPAHLTRLHQALTALPADDQARLGVITQWRTGPHLLTYRQTERTFGLVADALTKDVPDGLPSARLQRLCDDLLEASIPEEFKDASASLAVDWTDLETFSRPAIPRHRRLRPTPRRPGDTARTTCGPSQDSELFYGYYLSAAIMMPGEHGPPVPELARRMTLSSCHLDPARALVPMLTAMPAAGIAVGDVLADSGCTPTATCGRLGAASRSARPAPRLVQDLHPADRGPKGTHDGAVIANGNLYCPTTPRPLLELAAPSPATPPRSRGRSPRSQDRRDQHRHKLGRLTADDEDGYHRVMCPAAMGKIRCPLRPASMTLTRDRPEILTPPEHPPACCNQQTITVPPQVAAKTRQKHDYPSAAHRRSYARRTGAERTFSTAKDPATNNIARGWTRLTGLTPITLWLTTCAARRPQPAHPHPPGTHRQADDARRAAAQGLPPKTRRRRRKTPASLTSPQRRRPDPGTDPSRGNHAARPDHPDHSDRAHHQPPAPPQPPARPQNQPRTRLQPGATPGARNVRPKREDSAGQT